MQRHFFCLWCIGSTLLFPHLVQAQEVVADRFSGTQVVRSNNTFTITNGAAAETNLFHSFQEFSIPTNGAAIFDLTGNPNVSTIFNRVTGNRPSTIDGVIRTSRPANVFLLNPNGILFGANARLDIGGSFVGTTAASVRFSDRAEFSATNPIPLLTISTPIGLQFGAQPAAISIQGTGHRLGDDAGGFRPIAPVLNPGLRSTAIAFIGGDLNLAGGVITAPGGRITLGSVGAEATVGITAQGYEFNVQAPLGNITLSQRSLLDVSAPGSGSIQIVGRSVQANTGSLIFSQNQGTRAGGEISVFASDRVELKDFTREGVRGGILSETVSLGLGSPISVQTNTLTLQNASSIATRTFTPAQGGDIQIQTRHVLADGLTVPMVGITGGIATTTFGDGVAGNLNLTTQTMEVIRGGAIASIAFRNGAGGNMMINASESINITGATVDERASGISVGTFGAGRGGNLNVNTRRLSILDGGTIAGAAYASGKGGNITVNASESIQIDGVRKVDGSSINSDANQLPDRFIPLLGQLELTADAGIVVVNTPNLQMSNRGSIGVRNEGKGMGGELKVTANSIKLNNSFIQAITVSGEGGNVEVNADTLVMGDRSYVATSAGGTGNGGDIKINAPIIVGINDSDITANAKRGQGGRIEITTQGLFGLKYRDRQTSENDITASSDVGINGTVEITSPEVDPNSGLIELSSDLIDQNQQIAQNCAANQQSRFVITGRGGLPLNPLNEVDVIRTWMDLRAPMPSAMAATNSPQPVLAEATGWSRNSAGQIELIAGADPTIVAATCAN